MPRFLASFFDDSDDDDDWNNVGSPRGNNSTGSGDHVLQLAGEGILRDVDDASQRGRGPTPHPPTLCCVDPQQTFLTTLLLPSNSNNDNNNENESLFRLEMSQLSSRHDTFSGDGDDIPTKELTIVTVLPPVVQTLLRQRNNNSNNNSHGVRIVCVEGHGQRARATATHSTSLTHLLPRVAIYTRRTLVIVQTGYSQDDIIHNDNNNTAVAGKVVSVQEPLEEAAFGSTSCTTENNMQIIQVRPSPQHAHGYALLTPPTSLAILTCSSGNSNNTCSNDDGGYGYHPSRRYALRLWHGASSNSSITTGLLTTPLEWTVSGSDNNSHNNNNIDNPQDHDVVDFCFGQSQPQSSASSSSTATNNSTDLSLLSAVSVMMLHANGNVSTASPIVFRGTIVARPLLAATLRYLDDRLAALEQQQQSYPPGNNNDNGSRGGSRNNNNRRDSAPWRQCNVARTYLQHVFQQTSNNNNKNGGIAVANLSSRVAGFPATLSGPVRFGGLENNNDDDDNYAQSCSYTSLETIRGGPLVNVAIAYTTTTPDDGTPSATTSSRVDVLSISPTALIPRFDLESYSDRHELNDHVCKLAAIVERVQLSDSSDNSDDERHDGHSSTSCAAPPLVMIPDGTSLIHAITPASVSTISTNAVTTTKDQADTTAWSNVSIVNNDSTASNTTILGVVLVDTENDGPTLLVRLSDGSVSSVSVTQAKYRHLLQQQTSSPSQLAMLPASTTDGSLGVLESTPPLHETVQPLLNQMQSGLSQLTRLVGSQTRMDKIDPATLAVALEISQRCNEKLVLPMLELRQLLDARRGQLQAALAGQAEQLRKVQTSVDELRTRSKHLDQQVVQVQDNCQALGQRSRVLMQAQHDLTTALTEPERQLQEFVHLWDLKSQDYEQRALATAKNVARKSTSGDDGMGNDDDDWTHVPSHETLQLEQNTAFLEKAHDLLNGQKSTLKESKDRLQGLQRQLQTLARAAGMAHDEDESATEGITNIENQSNNPQ